MLWFIIIWIVEIVLAFSLLFTEEYAFFVIGLTPLLMLATYEKFSK